MGGWKWRWETPDTPLQSTMISSSCSEGGLYSLFYVDAVIRHHALLNNCLNPNIEAYIVLLTAACLINYATLVWEYFMVTVNDLGEEWQSCFIQLN